MAKKGTTKYLSNKQEKQVAKELKGKLVIASGALWGSKGDVRNNNLLVECKVTEKSSYSLNYSIWNKIRKEAIKDGLRIPVMCIEFKGGKVAVFEKLAFFDYNYYNAIINPVVLKKNCGMSTTISSEDTTELIFNCHSKGITDVHLICTSWDNFINFLSLNNLI